MSGVRLDPGLIGRAVQGAPDDAVVRLQGRQPTTAKLNLWGRAVECGAIEDPWAPAPPGVYERTVVTADRPVETVIRFESGIPVALDGERPSIRSATPELGEHTDAVLRDLGLDPAAIAALRARNVI